jgi:hypothetical protein
MTKSMPLVQGLAHQRVRGDEKDTNPTDHGLLEAEDDQDGLGSVVRDAVLGHFLSRPTPKRLVAAEET